MSRTATPATRNEATRRLKPPKTTTPAELTIGRHGHMGIARTAADGCERLRTVAVGCGRLRTKRNVEQTHLQPPDPHVKREPLLRIREKCHTPLRETAFRKRHTQTQN